ncbi:MAG TPA: Xaa-Pro dipeptidase [Pseudomonadales bacterium]|nr:Xaa-Pro dipeptidase [Pseudomonadales bacterium]
MPNLASLFHDHFDHLRQRYDAILAETHFDALQVYSGHTAVAFLDDRHYSFKINPHFNALLPATEAYAQSWIVYRPGHKPHAFIYLPDDYWHSYPPIGEDIWTAHFDVQVITDLSQMAEVIACEGRVATIGELSDKHTNWPIGEVNPEPLLNRLHWHRAVKSPFEVECMAEANRIAARAHLAANQAFRDGESEFGIHMAYCKAAGQSEDVLPYDNLISINEHGAVLHYSRREHDIDSPRRSFLIDAGATYRGYCSDITRTYAAQEGAFADLIDALDRLQLEIVSMVRDGTAYLELHRATHQGICRILVDHGVFNCDPQAAFDLGLSETFFPHGLGHFLGLQVHDIGGQQTAYEGGRTPPPTQYPALRTTRRIEAGQVLTIEPGIYFIESLLNKLRASDNADKINWQTVENLRPFGGIRIEDDVVVTHGEPRNLSREAFAALM